MSSVVNSALSMALAMLSTPRNSNASVLWSMKVIPTKQTNEIIVFVIGEYKS